jgi:hypothetical protein
VAALDQFVRVTSLVDPATRLLRPGMIWRALRARRRRLDGIGKRDGAVSARAEASPTDAADYSVLSW